MPLEPKSLADGQLPGAKTTLYTVPALTKTVIKAVTYVNTDASARLVNLYIKRSGSLSRRIIPKDMSLGAGYMMEEDKAIELDTADEIEGDASAANVVDFIITGVEKT